jgi:multicomponent Na+:H+ antiporter subunit G
MVILGTVIMWIGTAFMFFGVVGIFRFKNFYPRILVTSKIDTVGTLTLIIGLIIRNGFSFFSGKLLILAVIIIFLNPLVSHVVARSAYMSGHKNEEVLTEDDDQLE